MCMTVIRYSNTLNSTSLIFLTGVVSSVVMFALEADDNMDLFI